MFKQCKFVVVILIVMLITALACESSDDDIVVSPPDDEAADPVDSTENEVVSEEDDSEEVVSPTETPEPTEIPTEEVPVGTRRDNPAPAGSEILADDMIFKVLSTIRPADDIVMEGNQFNTDPEEGQEYLFVELSVTCAEDSVEKCNFSTFNLSALGSLGIAYDVEWFITGVDGMLEDTEFYGDTTISGYIGFIVGTDESDILLVYEPLLFGDTFFLALPEPTPAE